MNWDLVIKIVVPFSTLVAGKYLDRWLTKKPKLISYLGHQSSFLIPNGDNNLPVLTHSIVVKNAGRETANNVRIGHGTLPNYQITPFTQYEIQNLPAGGTEIVFPKLIPEEQITISYLYLLPTTLSNVNLYTKSDEGFAKILNVLPTPQLSKPLILVFQGLVYTGIVAIIYVTVNLIRCWLAV